MKKLILPKDLYLGLSLELLDELLGLNGFSEAKFTTKLDTTNNIVIIT